MTLSSFSGRLSVRRSLRLFLSYVLVISQVVPFVASAKTPKNTALPVSLTGAAVSGSRIAKVKLFSVKIGTDALTVTEKRGARGQLLERGVLGSDHLQVSIDRNGDGKLDEWEYFSDTLHIKMRDPSFGHFKYMDVEKIYSGKRYLMTFYRAKSGEYHLNSIRRRENAVMFDIMDDVVVGHYRKDEQYLRDSAQVMNEKLIKMTDDDLKKGIKAKIMSQSPDDRSCLKNPSFKNYLPSILDGITRVFRSDSTYTTQSRVKNETYVAAGPVSTGKSVQPTFLACMRQPRFGLDTHASRIEAALHTYLVVEKDPWPWRLSCEVSEKKNATGKLARGMTYPPSRGIAQEVAFVRQSNCKDDVCDSTPEQFAQTFFHEMIHYSGVKDEKLCRQIEQCCSQPNGLSSECTSLEVSLRVMRNKQKLDNWLIEQIPEEKRQSLNSIGEAVYGRRYYDKLEDLNLEMAEKFTKFVDDNCEGTIDNCRSDPAKMRQLYEMRGKVVRNHLSIEDCIAGKFTEGLTKEVAEGVCTDVKMIVGRVFDIDGARIPSAAASVDAAGGLSVGGKLDTKEAPPPKYTYCKVNEEHAIRRQPLFVQEAHADQSDSDIVKSICENIAKVGNFHGQVETIKDAPEEAPRLDAPGYSPLLPGKRTTAEQAGDPEGPADIEKEASVTIPPQNTPSPSLPVARPTAVPVAKTGENNPNEIQTISPKQQKQNQVELSEGETSARPIAQKAAETLKGGDPIPQRRDVASNSPIYRDRPEVQYAPSRTDGPRIPDYSYEPTERSRQISGELKQQTTINAKINDYFNKAMQNLVPEARADVPSVAHANANGSPLAIPDPVPTGGVSNTATTRYSPPSLPRASAGALPNGQVPQAVFSASSSSNERHPANLVTANGPRPTAAFAVPSQVPVASRPSNTPSVRPAQLTAPSEDRRASEALVSYLLGLDISRLKFEMKKPSMAKSLLRHRIAIIDETGERWGELSNPAIWLIYNQEKKRLVRLKEG